MEILSYEIKYDWEVNGLIAKVKVRVLHPVQQLGHIGTGLRFVTCGSQAHIEVTACDKMPNPPTHHSTEDFLV